MTKYRTKPGVEVEDYPDAIVRVGNQEFVLDHFFEPVPEEYVAECGCKIVDSVARPCSLHDDRPQDLHAVSVRVLRSMQAKIDAKPDLDNKNIADLVRENIKWKENALKQSKEIERLVEERDELRFELDEANKARVQIRQTLESEQLSKHRLEGRVEELRRERDELKGRETGMRAERDSAREDNEGWYARVKELEAGIRKFNSVYTFSQDDLDNLRALLPDGGGE